jgi:hypothetical protein
MSEKTLHRGGQTDPLGEHLGHFAHGGELGTRAPCHPGQPSRRLQCAYRSRAVGWRERP